MAEKNYSEKIFKAVEEYLTEKDWKFKTMEDRGVIQTGLRLRNKLKSTDIAFRIHQEDFVITLVLPIGAGEEAEDLARVNEFLTRANYGMRRGCFEMDFNDGEVGFRISQYCDEGQSPSSDAIEDTLFIGVAMVERYGDAFLKVVYDLATPEEAVDEAES